MAKSITKTSADPRDDQRIPSRIQEFGAEGPRTSDGYRGHNEQLSEPGNDKMLSGLPHKSDGKPRYDSQLSSPLATPSKVGKSEPVNPKK